ncbi:MAG: amidohydrolase [Eubacterium sp.]|nr:amidohydrolase [Candidatus Colimonas fimequi]
MTNFNEIYQNKLTAHRRNLHMIPEIDRKLPKTRAYLLETLEKLDCEITSVCDDGLAAFFDFGRDHAIAFRADMDALPVEEEVESEYKSTHPGFMHACGHDGHMSMVLTLGEYLGSLEECAHNVLLIFQPAEETLGGAEEICKTGVLDKYNVQAVFGTHMWPFADAGVVTTRPGALMPRSAEINIDINGNAAHGTSPYEGLDALFIATEYVQNLYKEHAKRVGAVQRFKDGIGHLEYIPAETPDQRTIIHIGKMTSGYARNIVSDYTHLLGTIRAYDDETFAELVDILTSQLAIVKEKYGCETAFSRSEGYPPVYNEPALFDKIKPVLDGQGDKYEFLQMPLMISEDFSFYGRYKPAVFFLLGTGTGISLHSTNFDFDETVLMSGFNLYKGLLEHTDFTL